MGIRLIAITGGKGSNGCLEIRRGRVGSACSSSSRSSRRSQRWLLYETVLRHPVSYIAGAGHDKQVLLGALLELLLIIANIGTAVVIFPIVRRQNEELALGYVTARLFECTFILVGILCMLGIITLRNQVAGPSEGTVAYTLAAIKDWTFLLGPGWVVGWGNGLILGYLMYSSGLVPRRATWLGLIGGPLIIVSGTAVMFTGNHPSNTLHSLQAIVTIPEFAVGAVPRDLLHDLGFQARCPDPFRERPMTTQPEPTPHTPDAATDALPPPRQRLLALSEVAFAPLFVIGWLTSCRSSLDSRDDCGAAGRGLFGWRLRWPARGRGLMGVAAS